MGGFFSSIGKYIGDAFNSFNPVSAIVSGGLGMLGSNIQNNHNANMMREQMKFHQQEREASQQFQTSERLAQQAYQTGERNAQNIWQESMYGKYQSPEAMVRQYNEAGINGRLAASGQAGMGSMSVSGGSNGGAPSSGAPSGAHVNPPYQNISAMSAGFESIAKSLHTLSETKRNGIETTYLEDTLKEELKQSRIKSALMNIDYDVQKLTARPMAQAALDKLMAEAKKENLNLSVINKQLDILENQRIISKVDADAAKERVRLELLKYSSEINEINKRAELHDADIDVRKVEKDLVQEKSKTEGSIRYVNYQTGKLRELEQATEKTKPELNKAIADLDRSLAALNWFEHRYNTFNKESIWAARNAENKSRVQVAEETARQAEIATEMAQRDADWQTVEKIVGVVADAAGTIFVGTKVFKSAKAAVNAARETHQPIRYSFNNSMNSKWSGKID